MDSVPIFGNRKRAKWRKSRKEFTGGGKNVSSLRWKTLKRPVSFFSSKCLPDTQKDITAPRCWDCIKCLQGTISMAIGSSFCARCEPETKSNKSSGEISFLLLFGSAVLFTLAVLQPSEPSNFLCSAATTLRYYVLSICITMLFLKTIRVTSVFEADKVAQLSTPCCKSLTRQNHFHFCDKCSSSLPIACVDD